MTEPTLSIVSPDYVSLLGYESAVKAKATCDPVLVVETEDEFYALHDNYGLPCVYPRGGKWLASHRDLITGCELVFVFTSPKYRIKAAKVFDCYASRIIWLSKDDAGHAHLEDFIAAHGISGAGDRLYELAFKSGTDYQYIEEQEARKNRIVATVYEWIAPKDIPERQWLYGNHLLRKYVSVTAAEGGMGKSRLLIGEALAMASGRNLFNQWVRSGIKVWVWNLEDDSLELSRCIQAACKRHGISQSDFAGRLYVDSGRQQSLCTAITGKNGAEILEPVFNNLVDEIKERGIDVLIVDPFVSSHRVNENDNGMIDAVVKAWAKVADRANCAVELVHHNRKSNGGEVTADSLRGGSAIVGAARDVRTLSRMTKDQGDSFGIENPRSYFRVGSAKSNFAPADTAQWYQIEGVSLNNDRAEIGGDSVGVCLRWTPPDPFDGITPEMIREALARLSKGDCKHNQQAKDWGGHIIAGILKVDTAESKGKSFMKRILMGWEKDGQIRKVTRFCHAARKNKPFIEVRNDA